MPNYWVSCSKFTCFVHTNDDNVIVMTASVWRKFEGQPFTNLINWLTKKFGAVAVEVLK
jgi:hypothetical protein